MVGNRPSTYSTALGIRDRDRFQIQLGEYSQFVFYESDLFSLLIDRQAYFYAIDIILCGIVLPFSQR